MKLLASTFMAKLFLDTIGTLDPFVPGSVKLPAPRSYLATIILWGLLGMASAFGPGPAKVAGRLGLLTLTTSLVLGRSGQAAVQLVSFLNKAAAASAQGGAS